MIGYTLQLDGRNATGPEMDALLDKFFNYSSLITYQADGDGITVSTVGTDTYLNNKVDVPLTLFAESGKLSLDALNKRIVHTGATTRYLFNGVASISVPGTNNLTVHIILMKNGNVLQDQTQSFTKLESLTGASTLNAASAIDMADGDYVELFAKTDKLDQSFDMDHVQLQFIECPRVVCGV